MNNMRFDWRWIAVFLVVAIIVGGQRVPWPLLTLALAGGGGYLLYIGWNSWSGGGASNRGNRVTYWRGQRIELPPERRQGMPSLKSIGPALFYFITGGALMLSAVVVVVRQIGG
jgi:hypothetical protein